MVLAGRHPSVHLPRRQASQSLRRRNQNARRTPPGRHRVDVQSSDRHRRALRAKRNRQRKLEELPVMRSRRKDARGTDPPKRLRERLRRRSGARLQKRRPQRLARNRQALRAQPAGRRRDVLPKRLRQAARARMLRIARKLAQVAAVKEKRRSRPRSPCAGPQAATRAKSAQRNLRQRRRENVGLQVAQTAKPRKQQVNVKFSPHQLDPHVKLRRGLNSIPQN